MTEKQTAAVEKIKRYFENAEKRMYESVMEEAKQDRKFRLMVQDMTISEALGGSKLAKNRHNFKK